MLKKTKIKYICFPLLTATFYWDVWLIAGILLPNSHIYWPPSLLFWKSSSELSARLSPGIQSSVRHWKKTWLTALTLCIFSPVNCFGDPWRYTQGILPSSSWALWGSGAVVIVKGPLCPPTSLMSPDEFGRVSHGTAYLTLDWRSWVYSEAVKFLFINRLSLNLGSRKGACICSLERHWVYLQLRKSWIILFRLDDYVGDWPDVNLAVLTEFFFRIKPKVSQKSSALKEREMCPPSQLQISEATEKFTGMVEGESSHCAAAT